MPNVRGRLELASSSRFTRPKVMLWPNFPRLWQPKHTGCSRNKLTIHLERTYDSVKLIETFFLRLVGHQNLGVGASPRRCSGQTSVIAEVMVDWNSAHLPRPGLMLQTRCWKLDAVPPCATGRKLSSTSNLWMNGPGYEDSGTTALHHLRGSQ